MKVFRLSPVLLLLVFLASCSLKPAWDLTGKWEKVDGKETLEFAQKGVVVLSSGSTTLTSTYKMADAKHLQIEVGSFGPLVFEIQLAGNDLVLKGASGQELKFKKVLPQPPAKAQAQAQAQPPAKAPAQPPAQAQPQGQGHAQASKPTAK